MNPRPLPVRIEPYDDEPWSGYLDRIAIALQVDMPTLYRRLGFPPASRGGSRGAGIAMTGSTRQHVAGVLNLDPRAISPMLLERFHGRAFQLPPEVLDGFDPRMPHRSSTACRPELVTSWLHWQPATRFCPRCRQDRPDRWYLSWRLPWHLYCLDHQHAIVTHNNAPAPTPIYEDDTAAAQTVVLDIIYGTAECPDPLGFIARLRDVVTALTEDPDIAWRRGGPALVEFAAALPDAVHLANYNLDARTFRTWRKVGKWAPRSVASPTANKTSDRVAAPINRPHLSGQSSTTGAQGLPTWIPEQLPLDVFAGDLSDLLYPLPLRQGRHIAALACFLSAAGGTLTDAVQARGGDWRAIPTFLRVLARLEADGRDHQFWETCRVASERLRGSGIDYQYRRRLSRDPAFRAAVRAELGTTRLSAATREWLTHDWAGELPWTSMAATPAADQVGGLDPAVLARLDAAATRAEATAVRMSVVA